MATIATTTVDHTASGAQYRLTPEKYTTINALLDPTKDFVIPQLVETYGEQGITGFLKMTGAIIAGGSADQVDWWEIGRRNRTIVGTISSASGATHLLGSITGGAEATSTDGLDPSTTKHVQLNDILMNVANGERYIVVDRLNNSDGDGVTIARLDAAAFSSADDVSGGTFAIVGNMYAQGSDQPSRFIESAVEKRTNPFTIVKESYQVSGSNATNIGYIDVGGGDYRWYIKGEMDARQRFLDARELTLLLGEKFSTADSLGGEGTEGYFSAVKARGIVTAEDGADVLDTVAELDAIIALLDKNGAAPEYAAMLNSALFAQLNSMPAAAGSGAAVTSGVAANFGAFQNNQEAAINLGFQSFARGGYTFHLKKMALLNSPNLMNNANGQAVAKGMMIPLTNVVDPRTGSSAPALELNYKAANGYNREMEHWVTGGGVLGFTNDTNDIAKFHYRSECCLITRAANQHVLIK